MTAEEFAAAANVSREPLDACRAYADALRHFQKTINLVSDDSLADLWRRHFLDSAQLLPLLREQAVGRSGTLTVLDVGSGAGFPALVLTILGMGRGLALDVHLVESDARKCAFLREAARAANVSVAIHNCRVEHLEPFPAHVITARAIAPVDKFLSLIQRFTLFPGVSPVVLLLKGRQARQELTVTAKEWKMTAEVIASQTEADAAVLRLRDISRG